MKIYPRITCTQFNCMLKDAMTALESEYNITRLPDGTSRKDPFGETYIRTIDGMVLPEGVIGRVYTFLTTEILDEFLCNFKKFLCKDCFISWRCYPELVWHGDEANTLSTDGASYIYARFTVYEYDPRQESL